ncbi:MAG: DUF4105 domain-containing protein [Planctomycetota bacterium]
MDEQRAESNDPEAPTRHRRGWWLWRIILAALWAVAAVVLTIAGAGTDLPLFAIIVTVVLVFTSRGLSRLSMAGVLAACMALVVARWTATPRLDRPWQPQLERQASAIVEGDRLTIRDVRDFRWNPDGSFEPSWTTREYSLASLRGIEMILEPFPANPLMAHTMLSFDFGEDGRLLLSIEARKEIGEDYGAIKGGLNRFELMYIFLDERDAYGIRAHEDKQLYAFPIRADALRLRAFLLSLCATANILQTQPRFYQIVRDNCTTAWIEHSDALAEQPLGLQLDTVFNGRIARRLHAAGEVETDLSYEEAKRLFRIDDRVLDCLDSPDFSDCIRAARTPSG